MLVFLDPQGNKRGGCPSYTSDLNACQEFEARLKEQGVEPYARYWEILHDLETGEQNTGHWCDLAATGHASAPHRCLALLKLLGKDQPE